MMEARVELEKVGGITSEYVELEARSARHDFPND